MTPAELQLAIALARIVRDGLTYFKGLKANDPEAYAQIAAEVDDALADAEAEAAANRQG